MRVVAWIAHALCVVDLVGVGTFSDESLPAGPLLFRLRVDRAPFINNPTAALGRHELKINVV